MPMTVSAAASEKAVSTSTSAACSAWTNNGEIPHQIYGIGHEQLVSALLRQPLPFGRVADD
eukprot:8488967-Prorocentrum_lima.AAC.1